MFEFLALLDDVVKDFGLLVAAGLIGLEGALDVVDCGLGMLEQVA